VHTRLTLQPSRPSTATPRARLTRHLCAAALALFAAACGGTESGRTEYSRDADSGAAAPATKQTLSPNPAMGSSTEAVAPGRLGAPAVAGDTLGARGQPVGTPTPATKRP
jgi:hypothetical protein